MDYCLCCTQLLCIQFPAYIFLPTLITLYCVPSTGFFADPVVEPSKSSGQISPVEDAPSEYYSVCSHSRSQSIAVSVSADFLSCIDEDEDKETELDLELASLKKRPSTLFFEVGEPESEGIEVEKKWWERRPSMSTALLRPPVSVAKLSLKRLVNLSTHDTGFSYKGNGHYPPFIPLMSVIIL